MLQNRDYCVIKIETKIMSEKNLIETFTKWRSRYLRQALRILPSVEDAEDVLQDAFVRLWPLSKNINSDHEATALTYITVRNLSVDRYRASRRENRLSNDLADLEEKAEP